MQNTHTHTPIYHNSAKIQLQYSKLSKIKKKNMQRARLDNNNNSIEDSENKCNKKSIAGNKLNFPITFSRILYGAFVCDVYVWQMALQIYIYSIHTHTHTQVVYKFPPCISVYVYL